jgi:hypothetical protein
VSGKYGFVDTFGKYAKLIFGVRPAFILDFLAVIFSSETNTFSLGKKQPEKPDTIPFDGGRDPIPQVQDRLLLQTPHQKR